MEAARVLSSLISLVGIAFVVFWLWRDYCVDRFRERMFMLRERLFDLAADGTDGLSFEAPAYHRLRTMINGQIRFAGQTDFISGPLMTLFMGSYRDEVAHTFEEEWQEALRGVTPAAATQLQAMRERMHMETLRHALFSVPVVSVPAVAFVTVVVLAVLLVSLVSGALAKGVTLVKRSKQLVQSTVDVAAFEGGCPA